MIKERKGDNGLRVCDICGHEQWVNYWNLVKKDQHLCRYCSSKASAKERTNAPWNRGTKQKPRVLGTSYVNSGGYVCVWVGKHTLEDKSGGYYLEHRLQAELTLDRQLLDEERVHHVDSDKVNNVKSNLYVCKNDKHHRNVHSQLERVSMELVKAGAIKFNHKSGEYFIDPYVREFVSKSLELLGSPEKDNQQRSFLDMSEEERSTTIQKWSTLKRVEAGDTQEAEKQSGDDIVSSA